jgi:uncharacterized phage protein (TIGR02218 family)
MPRSISVALKAHMQEPLTTLSVLILIERKDGVNLGFTSADRDITFDGETYQTSDGVAITAIQQSAGTGIDNLDVTGMLKDSRITDADIEAGRYDGAKVTVQTVNRLDLSMGSRVDFVGTIGRIETTDHDYTAEFRSLASALRQTRGYRTSATCTCKRLGDGCCKLTMTGNALNGSPKRAAKTLTGIVGDDLLKFTDAAPSGHYSNGIIKATSGANNNIERTCKAHVNNAGTAEITLRGPFPFAVTVGDTFLLEVGCNRTIAECRAKFGNANNFHGQPDLPGNDKATRVGRGS